MFKSIRMWIIEKLAGNEPILVGWYVNGLLIKNNVLVYIPEPNSNLSEEQIRSKAILTPLILKDK